jgi:hypothetical protein
MLLSVLFQIRMVLKCYRQMFCYLPSGRASRVNLVIVGGLLALVGFAGLFGVCAGRVAELYAEARSATSLAGTADREKSGS